MHIYGKLKYIPLLMVPGLHFGIIHHSPFLNFFLIYVAGNSNRIVAHILVVIRDLWCKGTGIRPTEV